MDWTQTIGKNTRVCSAHFLQKRFNKVWYFVLWAHLKISCISRICCVWNNVCVHVCKTINWRFIYIIICNCIYIVVINCGWNNNIAVKIVACWNVNVFRSSSWLDRHGSHMRSWNKSPLLYAVCVHLTVDWLFWNLYGSYIAPRPLLSWKKPGNFSFDYIGPHLIRPVFWT